MALRKLMCEGNIDNPRHFEIRWDQRLGRRIVSLKSVCWLRLSLEFDEPIRAGTWGLNVAVRPHQPSFPSGQPAKVKVTARAVNGGTEKHILCEEFQPECWESFDAEEKERFEYKSTMISRLANGWLLLQFKPFKLDHDSTLKFSWEDIENPHWKSGLAWDYAELERLDCFMLFG